jgi:hypothetical protein
MAVFVGNECEVANVVLNEATVNGNAGYGALLWAAGFKRVFKNTTQGLGYLNHAKAISETAASNGGGTVGVEFYKKAFGVRSVNELSADDTAQDRAPFW